MINAGLGFPSGAENILEEWLLDNLIGSEYNYWGLIR
jgi:hypothetical protein